MRRCILLNLVIVAFISSGCGKKETLDEATINRQCDIIEGKISNRTGVVGSTEVTGIGGNVDILVGEVIADSFVMPFDLDGDSIKEILVYVMLDRGTGGYWWLQYYEDGAWHLQDSYFMYANVWDIYTRKDGDNNLPRMFHRKTRSQSVSAVIFDREKGTVTLEPYDYQKFQDLKKRGLLNYEDIPGHDD